MKAIFYSKDPTLEPIILDVMFHDNKEYIIINLYRKISSIEGLNICDMMISRPSMIQNSEAYLNLSVYQIGFRYMHKNRKYYVCVDKYDKQLIEILKKLGTSSA